MGEVQRASEILHMTPQTLRLFLQQGKFGCAVKGTGSHWIYKIDWKEVEKYEENTNRIDSSHGCHGSNMRNSNKQK